MTLYLCKSYSRDHIKEDEMFGSCTYGGKKMHTEFLLGVGSIKERNNMKDTGIDGNIITKRILKK
jgi:hypothetical protein